MQNRRFSTIAAAVTVAALAAAGTALGHSGATGVVKTRMEAMKDIAAAMKIVGPMASGAAAFDAEKAAGAARTIGDHASMMPNLFPEDSVSDVSEARPRIWREWETFLAEMDSLSTAATNLSAAAEANDAETAFAAFEEAAGSCKSCHEKFRIKK